MRLTPIVQFPNAPLIIALIAALIGHFAHGTLQDITRAIFYVSLTIWAYEEARNGHGWFRRGLGIFFLGYILVALTRSL